MVILVVLDVQVVNRIIMEIVIVRMVHIGMDIYVHLVLVDRCLMVLRVLRSLVNQVAIGMVRSANMDKDVHRMHFTIVRFQHVYQ